MMGSALYRLLLKSVKHTENPVPISSSMSSQALFPLAIFSFFPLFTIRFWPKILLNDFGSVAFLLHSHGSWICEMNCPLRIAQVLSDISIRKRFLFIPW